MGNVINRPVHRKASERRELQVWFVVHAAAAYVTTFRLVYPGLEALAASCGMLSLAMLVRVAASVLHAFFVFVCIPYFLHVLMDSEGYFYCYPSVLGQGSRQCCMGPVLWSLPWIGIWPLALAGAWIWIVRLFCTPCMERFLKTKIDAKHVAPHDMACPGCLAPFEASFLMAALPASLQDAYATAVKSSTLGCPTCDMALPKESWWARRVMCRGCKAVWCRDCRRPFHVFPTCLDKTFVAWCRAHGARPCPNCQRMLLKDMSSCAKATCVKCLHRFKWVD
ncbi:hypothetical protein ACHHYP_16521 [Achlya hypogyna]|uniref:RING-type domain-containing protein n=1 Tax=Achlya hypogyna TaxID=1202772 RepID=A0A1V9Y6E5_ACHHY|nr:hypothetical protein ACHHYP_16521 [Achlya hypogyna]